MSQTVDQTVEPADQQEPDPRQDDLEQRARRMGWRPRNEFRGEPERWMEADEFVERGERMLPVLQERNRAADRTIVDLQQQIQAQGETLNTMLASARKAEQVGYRRAMQELHQQRNHAVETGDIAAFQAVEQAIRELGPPPPEPPPPPPPRPQAPPQEPVVQAWVAQNPWFMQNRSANVTMIAEMQEAERMMPGASTEQHLAAAEAVVRRRYPELFPAPRRLNGGDAPRSERRPMHVEEEIEEEPMQPPQRRLAAPVARSSPDAAPRRVAPRSFEAIPHEHRAQFERQRKMLEGKGEPFTKEEFARYYFENESE